MSLKLTRTLMIGLVLSAPAAALAQGGSASARSLDCPAGTRQVGTVKDGLYCRKAPKGGEGGLGDQHGPYRSFHENGQVAAQGQYTDGFKTGLWTFFDDQGHKQGEVTFVGSNYHGQRVSYFPDGQKKSVEEYQHGRRQGLVQRFDRTGHVVSQARYENNVKVANQ